MNSRLFDTLPLLSKNDALKILKTPIDKLKLSSDYYKAVFHLYKYPSTETENALLDLIASKSSHQSILIAKRKAIEVLGKMKCKKAIPLIGNNLKSGDPYIVENAAWALQEIGCNDSKLHSLISSFLERPGYNYRVLVQSLGKMGAISELPKIKKLLHQKNLSPSVKGASLAAISMLSDESIDLDSLIKHLDLPNQNDRQSAVQDIIDAKANHLLKNVIRTPISPFFRLRAIDILSSHMDIEYQSIKLIKLIDCLINDHPNNIRLIDSYKFKPDPNFLVNQLFSTDFSICYSALKELIEFDHEEVWKALNLNWCELRKDYGALYFFVTLCRHLDLSCDKNSTNTLSLIQYCLDSSWPDFMKFKSQAILTSIYINVDFFKSNIIKWLDEEFTPYWACRYSALLGLEVLLKSEPQFITQEILAKSIQDSHRLVRMKSENVFYNNTS